MSFLFIQNESNGTVSELDETASRDPRRSLTSTGKGFDPVFSRGRVTTESRDFDQSKMVVTPASNSNTVIWIHVLFYVQTGYSNGVIYVGGTNSPKTANLKLASGSGAFRITTATGTTIASTSLSDGTYNADVMINTGSGKYEILVDGVSKTKGTSSAITSVDPSVWDALQVIEVSAGRTMSEIIITEDVNTVGMRVISMAADTLLSGGNLSGDVSTINELALDEDGLVATEAGESFFGYDDINPSINMADYEIAAVNIATVASCDSGFEANGLVNSLRFGSNLHTQLDFLKLDTVSDRISANTTFEINPETGLPFTATEINALEAGVMIADYPDVIITHNQLDTTDGLAMGFSDTGRIIGTADLITAGDTQDIARITVNPVAKTAIVQLDFNSKWNNQSSITVTAVSVKGSVAEAILPFTTNNYAGPAETLADLFIANQDGKIAIALK